MFDVRSILRWTDAGQAHHDSLPISSVELVVEYIASLPIVWYTAALDTDKWRANNLRKFPFAHDFPLSHEDFT